jgi:Trp operon repressor
MKEIKEGKRQFTPDREKDLLTLVLGNDEREALVLRTHGGFGLPKTKRLIEAEREQRSESKEATAG